ncbi:hypothetical protein [Crassaminicella profunda]|uniref:hypothetical protein n=1 Tax=Crassaminicella profunda TaxID=1286698 RepID=UPI001CA647EF|nr:hypothetical protein [Crassaminicella profunda]QZY54392.1 hypothetical protein K7H06_15290 [Crassaminicella profunda]
MNQNDTWVKVLLAGAILMLIAQIAKLPILLVISFPVVMVSWMTLGALRKNKVGKGLKFSLISLYIIWTVGFLAMTLMENSTFNGTVLGFMPSTAIMIYGVWLLPYIFGTLVYGFRFDKDYLDENDIVKFEKQLGHETELH